MEACRDQELAPSHVMETLDMFISHIVKSCPFEKASVVQSRLSEISYMGLSFITLFHVDDENDPRLRPLQDALPKILEWNLARYVYKKAPEKNLVAGYHDLNSLAMFMDAIHRVRRNKDVKLALLNPRWLELDMVIWLDPDTRPQWKLTILSHFVRFIDDTITHNSDVPMPVSFSKALDDLQAAAHGDPEVLIDPCLNLLIKQSSDLHCESSVINGAADTLAKFSGIPRHPVTLAVKKKGSIAVFKALARITDPSPPKGDGSLLDAFCILAALVSSFSRPEYGPTWLLRALQTGFLVQMASRISKIYRTYQERILLIDNLLSKYLPAHLSNPSIIFATENALSELSAGDHEQFMNSIFKEAWKTFIHRFFEQYVFYCYFEVAGTRKGCYKVKFHPYHLLLFKILILFPVRKT